MTDMTRATWRKSSRSGAQGNCLQVATNLPGIVAIRDSKHPDSPVLAVPTADWRALLNTLDQP